MRSVRASRRITAVSRLGGTISASLATLLVFGASAAADPAPVSNCTQVGLAVTCTYAYPGVEQQFLAPPGVTTLLVDAIGGAGGGQHISSAHGGQADEVTGDVTLTSPILYVE